MTPILLDMQAFGPYLHQTKIDFTKLGTDSLFLITGATGGISADLAAGNAILHEMTDPSFLCTNVPIPLHAGAEKYYSELGLLEA